MKKSTQISIVTALVFVLIAGVFAFFAWATEWFTSTKKLREIFGGDSHNASAIAAEPKMTPALLDIDSDSNDADNEYVLFAAPTEPFSDVSSYIDDNNDLVVYTNGYWGDALIFELYDSEGNWLYDKRFEYSATNLESDGEGEAKSEEFRISFDELRAMLDEYALDNFLNFSLYNEGGHGYLDSNYFDCFYYLPEESISFTYTDTYITCPAFVSFSGDYSVDSYKVSVGYKWSDNSYPEETSTAVINNMEGSVSYGENITFGNEEDINNPWVYENEDNTFIIDLAYLPYLYDAGLTLTITIDCEFDSSSFTPSEGFINKGLYCSQFNAKIAVNKLSKPANFRYDSEKKALLWDAVEGATAYAVRDGNKLLGTVTGTSFDISDINLENSNHTFKVRALGNLGR